MVERPIIFSGPMVRAILDGRKTQTRRLVKPRGGWTIDERDDGRLWPMDPVWSIGDGEASDPWWPCPYGESGDRLWVKETFGGSTGRLFYRADFTAGGQAEREHVDRWKTGRYMPRSASRITLEVTGVRVERLQDISENDALAEGVAPAPFCKAGRATGLEHVEAFEDLWDAINGKRATWASNPWVWVVEFRRVT